MGIRKTAKNVLYFTVGAVATGMETLSAAADILIDKGADVVARGKEALHALCVETFFPDNGDPAVIIEEDAGSDEASDAPHAEEQE